MGWSPESLFGIANLVALTGWVILAAGIALKVRFLRDVLAGLAVPALLAVGYTAVIAAQWSSAEGSFSTLDGVRNLFRSPWLLLAGWIHYLAFDLFVGAWIARDAETRGQSRLLMLPVLPATFLFGPAGLLLWLGLRTTIRPRASAA